MSTTDLPGLSGASLSTATTPTVITVEGRFDHHHPAERGTVLLAAGFQGPNREPVLARTGQLHGELAADAERMRADGAVTWWSADRMRAWSERPWNKDGTQLPPVHHASVALEVKFADLAQLATWAERIAAADGVTVTGIRWTLTEVTKERLTADAQHRAVQDAVARATAYARSIGLTSVRPLAIADPGMLGDESRPQSAPAAAPGVRAAVGAAQSGGLELKPEDITVSARVHARFAAS